MTTELTPADRGREISKAIIDTFYKTNDYPYTQHHIASYNHFMGRELISIIQSNNPILILKNPIPKMNAYSYEVKVYVGGEDGTRLFVGTPTIDLHATKDVRLLYPNEARLRGLSYEALVTADIVVKIKYNYLDGIKLESKDISPDPKTFLNLPFFRIPIMLHSNYCVLHNKPKEFLHLAGECIQDHGGYFIVDGSEKVLVAKQESAFNTLYITKKDKDPRDARAVLFAYITCLSAKTRRTKRITFRVWDDGQILVGLPMVQAPIPLFIVFRALGFQSDEEIMRLFYPDFETDEAKLFMPKLQPSIVESWPFLNSYLAIQYIKYFMKGRTEAHVIDVIKNQLFTHMPNDTTSQGLFLADCVKKCIRVTEGYDTQTDRDDMQNSRTLVSGFLIQMLFNSAYDVWIRAAKLAIDREWEFHKSDYANEKFTNIFQSNQSTLLFNSEGVNDKKGMNDIIRGAFKGKWNSGPTQENEGILQALSRLSYCDFMSHCRRVILNFDTSSKLRGPRYLHPSQYGYYCTNETPSGASIGVAKNMSVLTAFSINYVPDEIETWLLDRVKLVVRPVDVLQGLRDRYVPVYINGGLFGYTIKPYVIVRILKAMKRTGCIPYSSSIVFSIRERRVKLYFDGGRPLRPLIVVSNGKMALKSLKDAIWRRLVLGTLPTTETVGFDMIRFTDIFKEDPAKGAEDYITALEGHMGSIEYLDPYEQNESYIANFENNIGPTHTHMEIHPSTILSIMTAMIPFCNHNQSLRNQLGDSQSKQGVSMYATNWENRFDNTANVLCYGESHLTGTIYSKYMGEGQMPYGQNVLLAIAPSGYNQDDGFVFNASSFQRGLFRSINYRSYHIREEEDEKVNARTLIANPTQVPDWTDLRPGLNYRELDERGIIREGAYCDENTVLVGAYSINNVGVVTDASLTPQVWTKGRVEKVVVTVDNGNHRTVRVRIVQDRSPEVGDKFSNRHGQKGTAGVLMKAEDLPRTKDGITPDMIMNMHAIPSRMTIGQNIEQLFGKAAALTGALADGTVFMNDGSPEVVIGSILEQHGFEKYGNEIFYDGTTGVQMEMALFMGPVFEMRLKHMVEDKWQARGQGRKEQITHQPTGGRGAQGGLKIGEMDRDAIVGHCITAFQRESFMKRSDAAKIQICTGCGTVPIFNPSKKSKISINQCTLCNGPPKYIGTTNYNMEILPITKKQKGRIVTVELPYATNVLLQELASIANVGLRLVTTADTERLRPMETKDALTDKEARTTAIDPLIPIDLPEPFVEDRFEEEAGPPINPAGIGQEASNKETRPASDAVLESSAAILTEGAAQNSQALFQEGTKAEAQEAAGTAVAPVNPVNAPVNTGVPPVNAGQVPANATQVPAPAQNSGNDLLVQVNKQEGGAMTLTIQQPQQQPRSILRQPTPLNTIHYPTPIQPQRTDVFPPPFPGASPTISVQGGYMPEPASQPPVFSIDTSYDAMMADGLMPPAQTQRNRGFGNPLRQRGPLDLPASFQQQAQTGAPTGKFVVNKLG